MYSLTCNLTDLGTVKAVSGMDSTVHLLQVDPKRIRVTYEPMRRMLICEFMSHSIATIALPCQTPEADITDCRLDAYYVYCHAYFPALPPPIRTPVDRPVALGSLTGGYEPSTPLSLALSAMLALIPLSDDPDPKGENSTWNRRIQAHKFAQAAFQALDNETELVDSIINPKDALSNGSPRTYRAAFHRDLPLDLESNVALMVLSIYEYGQRGNIKKMLNRSGQSLMLALEAKLYSPIMDQFVEARRRVWWATVSFSC